MKKKSNLKNYTFFVEKLNFRYENLSYSKFSLLRNSVKDRNRWYAILRRLTNANAILFIFMGHKSKKYAASETTTDEENHA